MKIWTSNTVCSSKVDLIREAFSVEAAYDGKGERLRELVVVEEIISMVDG